MQPSSEEPSVAMRPGLRCLITGGGGYIGRRLAAALTARGDSVSLADVRFGPGCSDDGCQCVSVDVSDAGSVDSAVAAGFDCVFHVASFGMSGRDMLKKDKIYAVNVTGTENVISACLKHSVKCLVYTSTYNVVFGGQEVCGGDETLPYLPMDKHVDAYSRTKSAAEQLVLAANLPPRLATCALRLAGVYGPGEERHLPRIVTYMAAGVFRLRWGLRQATVDFLHVDNLVQAHVKAADRLLGDPARAAGGRAFFISDGAPVPNFDFFAPLARGLGYPTPCVALPYHLVYGLAWLTEAAHLAVGRWVDFQPLLTRAEVCKTGVTHHFSIAAARAALGYEPTVCNDLASSVLWFRRRGWGERSAPGSGIGPAMACLVCLVLLAMALLPLAVSADWAAL